MKYSCRYPNHLNRGAYFHKVLDECLFNRQCDVSEYEMRKFLSFVIVKITLIIEDPENNLNETLNYLLKIVESSREKLELIPRDKIKPGDAFDLLCGIIEDPLDLISLIANNMRFELKREQQEYVNFLQQITIKCIKDIVEANKPRLRMKKTVSFNSDQHKSDETEQTQLFQYSRRKCKRLKVLTGIEENVGSGSEVGRVLKKRRL